jgi:hypothetical protein
MMRGNVIQRLSRNVSKVLNYHYTLRNILEERRSDLGCFAGGMHVFCLSSHCGQVIECNISVIFVKVFLLVQTAECTLQIQNTVRYLMDGLV